MADLPDERFADPAWREAVAAAGEFLTFVDADLRILHVNRVQPGAEDAVGSSVLDWVDPGDHDTLRRAVAAALASARPQHFTSHAFGPEGERARYSNWVIRLQFRGHPDCVAFLGIDLSHLGRTEAAAGRVQARLEAIAGGSPDFLMVVDRDHNIQFINRVDYGVAREDLLGKPFVAPLPADQHAKVTAALNGVFATGRAASYETWADLPAGRREFSTRLGPIERDGRVEAVTVVVRDITEMAHAREALRESEARYRMLVEHSPQPITVMDLETGKFVEANEAAERLFGRTHQELLELGPADVSPAVQPDGRPSVTAAREFVQAAVDGRRPHFEWTHRNRQGEDIPCEIWLTAPPSPGAPLVQGNITDLRPRKAAEREQQRLTAQLQQASKLQAIGQLTGGVAHDFNNLLTVIIGNAELIRMGLAERGGDDDAAALCAGIVEAAERGSALTHHMLAFSRKQPLQPRRVDLNQLVGGMEDLLRRTLGETIAVATVPAAGLWPCEVDPAQLENALLNLAINARDAMPGGGTLTMTTANVVLAPESVAALGDAVPGDYVVITVADTGHGIDAGVLDKVFEPFFTTKGVGEGSGLGLSMVYGFSKQSGGHVTIASPPGAGTTVRLYLPRATRETDSTAPRPAAGGSPAGAGELVLVVEDDPRVRRMSTALLERLGYRTLDAGTAAEGLELLADESGVELLFTDVVLPGGMSGVQLAAAARERRPGLKVLFTSGYAEDALSHHGRLDPAVELLEKPFTLPQLAQRVRAVLEG